MTTTDDPHPYYGPCDAFAPDGGCIECVKVGVRKMTTTDDGEFEMTQHTPGPWVADYRPDITLYQVAAIEGGIICFTHKEQDAKFIARACNSHYELLEALEFVANFNWRNNRKHLLDIVTAAIANARGQ